MQRKFIVILVSSVVLVVALVSIWCQFRPATVPIDRAPIIGAAVGVGTILAEETVAAIHGQGRIVLVTDYDHTHGDRGRDYRWEAFQDEIKKHSAVSAAVTEIVAADPSEPVFSGCPSAAFKAILERQAGVAAIVFFIDLPEWSKVAAVISRPVGPKIMAVDNVGVPALARYAGYFSSGILTVLIGAQPAPGTPSAVQPTTPRQWFDQYYRVYTPQNYETLLE